MALKLSPCITRVAGSNETGETCTLLTLAAFITHEARRAAARYIGKVDDDAFVHVADLLALTRRLGATVPDRMQYVGMLTWSSWLPEKCAG